VTGIPLSTCGDCGWEGFPQRQWCPFCGTSTLGVRLEERGLVEDTTILRRAPGENGTLLVRLGTIRLEGGAKVVARLDAAGRGARVRVELVDGAPVARPF
jgi:uncharacterized OB-fold protein